MGRRIAGEGEHPFPAPDGRKVRLGRPGPQRGPGPWMAMSHASARLIESGPHSLRRAPW